MSTAKNISVIGGDTRQIYTALYLSEKKYNVTVCGFEYSTKTNQLKNCSCVQEAMKNEIIILPLPVTKNKKILNTAFAKENILLDDIIKLTNEKHKIFFGMAPKNILREFQGKGACCNDYFENEEFTLKNALLTSEGIISVLLEKIPSTIFKMKIAITGYGRIAEYTAQKLKLLGADVTIFARNPVALTKAENCGLTAHRLKDLILYSNSFDCIINTVPSLIITDEIIKQTRQDVLLVETSSAPYGIDFIAAENLGRSVHKAFSLPGKTAPKTAGIIIAQTIEQQLEEV